MDPLVREFLGLGVAGAVVAAMLTGILNPKWVVDYIRSESAAKDKLIAEQTEINRRLADAIEDLTKRGAK